MTDRTRVHLIPLSSSPSTSTSTSTTTTSSSGCGSSSSFPFQSLDCYRAARELAALVHRASISDGELRDQATRAAKSVFLNLSEGLPDDRPSMRRKFFLTADGSLHEVVAAVDLAQVIGAIGTAQAAELLALAGRLRGMLRGLLRATGRAR